MSRRAAYCQKGNHHQDRYNHWMAAKKRRWEKRRKFHSGQSSPAVNIQEYDDKYELFLSAPGLSKEEIKVSLSDNFLTISAERKQFELGENAKWKMYEFTPGGFKREFELSEKIDLENISAKYEGGILIMTFPKFESSITSRHEINIV